MNINKILSKYKNEIGISLLAFGAVSFIIMNLQTPKSPQELKNEVSQLDVEQISREISSHSTKTNSSLKQNKIKKRSFEDKMAYTFFKMKKIENCLDENCSYPDNDPREYSLSVYKDLSLRVSRYKDFWARSWSRIELDQQKYIISLLKLDDGFVKKEILSLLSSLPKSEANKHLNLILNDVIGYHDSKLIPVAMTLLARTKTPENEIKVSKALSTAIKQGSPHVSEEISKNIHKFISPRTAHLYEETLPKLPKAAAETTFLTSALTEYEMLQSGG